MPPEMQAHFMALSHTPLVWMAEAASGQTLYLAMIFSAAAALAILTLRLTERAFVEGSQRVAENDSAAMPGTADAPFRGGVLWLEARKNQRLIVRTPMMTVQCLAQALMPIGIACVLARDDIGRAVAFFAIFAAGVLSGMFTIAAGTVEECGDLLAMSPCRTRLFRFGKMVSGWVYPLGVTLVVGVVLLIVGEWAYAAAVILGGIPLGLADPIMMIPLLGMQIVSGTVAGGCVFAASFSGGILVLALLASYLILLLAIGLAQFRQPLF
jgi:hypothetical protein